MEGQVITLAPGEERILRIVCSGEVKEEEMVVENTTENLSEEDRMAKANRRGTRKNRKNVAATRKNRKQSGGNSYMNFAKEERKRVLAKHPELKSRVVDVARKIGEAWRKLSDAEKSKY